MKKAEQLKKSYELLRLCKEVMANEESKKILIDAVDARSVFVKTVVAKMKESPDTEEILNQKCSASNHSYEPFFCENVVRFAGNFQL